MLCKFIIWSPEVLNLFSVNAAASSIFLWPLVILPPAIKLWEKEKKKKTSLSPNPSVKWSTHLVKHTYLCGGNSRCSWARSILLTTCPVHLHLLSSHQYTACNTTASLNHAQMSWEKTSTEILKNRHQSHICIADIKWLLTAVGYNAFVLR